MVWTITENNSKFYKLPVHNTERKHLYWGNLILWGFNLTSWLSSYHLNFPLLYLRSKYHVASCGVANCISSIRNLLASLQLCQFFLGENFFIRGQLSLSFWPNSDCCIYNPGLDICLDEYDNHNALRVGLIEGIGHIDHFHVTWTLSKI